MAGALRLLDDSYRTDLETMERVAAELRNGPTDIRRFTTATDRARLRAEIERIVNRLRAAKIEVVPSVR
ncbi:hypothetical protein [Nocardia sp. NPDC002869]|uniref:hypothetical protein n=1 Tax=Nocardia sp. NPDC002869 TaxID=3161032 RepID=UPI00398C94D6